MDRLYRSLFFLFSCYFSKRWLFSKHIALYRFNRSVSIEPHGPFGVNNITASKSPNCAVCQPIFFFLFLPLPSFLVREKENRNPRNGLAVKRKLLDDLFFNFFVVASEKKEKSLIKHFKQKLCCGKNI